MFNSKRRSSLKKIGNDEDPVRSSTRRISFSGKKFIREFDKTEKPRDYDHSYEISDHTTGDDSSGQSHVTTSVSTFHATTTRVSYTNEFDNENIEIEAALKQNNFSLQLQTSVNVTLMPHELPNVRQPMDMSGPFQLSYSLTDSERDRLCENSLYRVPISEKTMDLIPSKMTMAQDVSREYIDREEIKENKENIQCTIAIPTDMSCVEPKQQDVKQKTIVFESNNITCDFSDIDPHQAGAASPEPMRHLESFDMGETNFLATSDDDTMGSSMIDVLTEAGRDLKIGLPKKLNFRQLNEALNAGQLQLFPNGPKTPTTDRKAKSRFWRGLEAESEEKNVPLREAIKPRATLNFNDESMIMSPIPTSQSSEKPLEELPSKPLPGKLPSAAKRNNRFSQADELMLDNTNFLVHAKVGDETSSRNSSKCTSRRETTYDNSAMELDDLETREAAVVAAVELAKRRPLLQRTMPVEEDFDMPNMTTQKPPVDTGFNQTLQLHESIVDDCLAQPTQRSKPRPTLHMTEDIEEDASKVAPAPCRELQKSSGRRQTLVATEPIEEDPANNEHNLKSKMESNRRRQTLHMEEAMEEEATNKTQTAAIATPYHAHHHRRQTLHMAESIEEDTDSISRILPAKREELKRRQTIHMAEAMEEDVIRQETESSTPNEAFAPRFRPRPTLHMAEAIEEDKILLENEFKSQTFGQSLKGRQTLHMVEAMEEDAVIPSASSQFNKGSQKDIVMPQNENKSSAAALPPHKKGRPSIIKVEPIEEDGTSTPMEITSQPSVVKTSIRGRQTLHVAEPIEEDIFKTPSQPTALNQGRIRRRQTLLIDEPIEEDGVKPQMESKQQTAAVSADTQNYKRRQTLHLAEAMDEDVAIPQKSYMPPQAPVPVEKRRQTLHMTEAIEEDDIDEPKNETRSQHEVPQMECASNGTLHMGDDVEEHITLPGKATNFQPKAPQKFRRRQTLHIAEDIDEDEVRPQKEQKAAPKEAPSQRRRQTLHISEDIDEDEVRPHNGYTYAEDHSIKSPKGRTLHLTESIVADVVRLQIEPNPCATQEQQAKTHRPTLHLAEPIMDDAAVESHHMKRRRQTVLMVEPIEEDNGCDPHSTNAQGTLTAKNYRQTMHLSEPIEEELGKPQQEREISKEYKILRQSMKYSESVSADHEERQLADHQNLKGRQAASRLDQSMEEDSFVSRVPTKETHYKPRATVHMTESKIEEPLLVAPRDQSKPMQTENSNDDNLIYRQKSRKTVYLSEPIEVDKTEEVPPPIQSHADFVSQSFEKVPQNSGGRESPSDSTEWLAQMNAKTKQALLTSEESMKGPRNARPSHSQLFKSIVSKTLVETPETNKTRQSYFPITPGRSMIEYEELEDLCKSDSPKQTVEPKDMDMDINVSSYGTPIAVSKRLPTHLTPNLPEPKKRSTHLPQMELCNSPPQVEDSRRNYDDIVVTPRTTSKSRIPVPCRTISHSSPWQQTEQLEDGTVQMVRAQMMRQTNSHFEVESLYPTEEKLKSMREVNDDNPITISDVSKHFAAQNELAKLSLGTGEEVEPKNSSGNSRASSERRSYARAHMEFINLSGDTVILDAAEVINLATDELENTRLSLVSTLLDEEEDNDVNVSVAIIEPELANEVEAVPAPTPTEPEACLKQLNPPAIAGAEDACRKCKHCRRSIDRRRQSESLTLRDFDPLEEGIKMLKQLRQQPKLAEVNRYWYLKGLERDVVASARSDIEEDEKPLALPEMLQMFNKAFNEYKSRFPDPVIPDPFTKRLRAKLEAQLPRWLLDAGLRSYNQYVFMHRKITTLRILVEYEPLDIMEQSIRVRRIKALNPYCNEQSTLGNSKSIWNLRKWNATLHLLDFQIRLKLPLDLMNLLDGNEVDDLVKFLMHVDALCMDTRRRCDQLQLTLFKTHSELLRQPNRMIVKKTVSKLRQVEKEAYKRLERIDFVIEIGNIEETSFTDIQQPPLYQFDEKIQYLPKGLDFLASFLPCPEKYLKAVKDPMMQQAP